MAIDPMKLCMGCMTDKGSSTVCPYCGWVEGNMPDVPQHLPPRTILREKYMLGRVLGYGGFGVTYLAWDMDLNLKVAVKEYLPQNISARSPGTVQVTAYSGNMGEQYRYGLEKFLEEARTIAQFDGHPNIVSIRDFFRANSTAYYVMSYLEGMTLKQYLAKHSGALPYDLALTFFMPVLDALAAVHKVGILHRDISPDNVFITNQGLVKVLDFGAARQVAGGQNSLSVILKPGYAPEEQYRTKGNQGPWTDIYACAAMLYRMLTGQLPPESLDRLESDTLVQPSTLGIEIPLEAEAALMQALSVKAVGRFQSIAAFQNALVGSILSEGHKAVVPPVFIAPLPPVSQSPANQAPVLSSMQPLPKAKSPLRWVIPVAAVAGVGVLALMTALAVNVIGNMSKPIDATASLHATSSAVLQTIPSPSIKATLEATLPATQATTAVATPVPTPTLEETATPLPSTAAPTPPPLNITTVFSNPRMVKSVDKDIKPGATTDAYSARRSMFYFFVDTSGTKAIEEYKLQWIFKDTNALIFEANVTVESTTSGFYRTLYMTNDDPWVVGAYTFKLDTIAGANVLSLDFYVGRDPMAYLPKANSTAVYHFKVDDSLAMTRHCILVKPGIWALLQLYGQSADVNYIRLSKTGSLQFASDSDVKKWQLFIPALPITGTVWKNAFADSNDTCTLQGIKNDLAVNTETYNDCLQIKVDSKYKDTTQNYNYTYYVAPGLGEVYFDITSGTYKGTVEYLKSFTDLTDADALALLKKHCKNYTKVVLEPSALVIK